MEGAFAVIFYLIVLIFSVMAHEVAHGAVADKLGDPTARLAGRLNFNPINHIDPFGSIILPALLYFITQGSFVFGWAKPVPYNPYNLKNPERAAGLIAAAGPVANFSIALVFGIFLQFSAVSLSPVALDLLSIVVFLNIGLAIFNLVPLPPLDGSKVLFAFLPREFRGVRIFLEQHGMILLLFFMFFGFQLIVPIIQFLYRLMVGGVAL